MSHQSRHSSITQKSKKSKKTQNYVPLSKYITKGNNRQTSVFTPEPVGEDRSHNLTLDNNQVDIAKILPGSNSRHKSRADNKLFVFSQNNNNSADKMSFGQFMDSFEQQKDQIVKEWLQKNNVELPEHTSRFNKNMNELRSNEQ
jgi:hypothetical protein